MGRLTPPPGTAGYAADVTCGRARSLSLAALWALGGCSAAAVDSAGPAITPHKDLLMVSIDTLRKDHVGRYSGLDTTPFLDELLAGGLTLEAHRSCSNWTYGSSVCAMTGFDGVDLGWIPHTDAGDEAVPDDVRVLPDLLKGWGFTNGLASSNGFMGPPWKKHGSYDSYAVEELADAARIVELGLAGLEAIQGAERWFMHLHFIDPHSGYSPPEEYLEGLEGLPPLEWDLDTNGGVFALEEAWGGLSSEEQALVLQQLEVRYEGELRYLDDQLRGLFAELEDRGALEDTLVVIWSDHGEQFGEHGALQHGNGLYAEEVHGIAALLGPYVTPGAVDAPTSHADLVPTLLSRLGISGQYESGGLVVDTLAGSRPLFGVQRRNVNIQSVDLDGWRLQYEWDGTVELYDLAADPRQQDNQVQRELDRAREMYALLTPRISALQALSVSQVPDEPDWGEQQ